MKLCTTSKKEKYKKNEANTHNQKVYKHLFQCLKRLEEYLVLLYVAVDKGTL